MVRVAAVAAALVLAGTAASCGGDDPEPRADPTTTEPTTSVSPTTAPELSDEEQIRQLIEEWWQVNREIGARQRDAREAAEFLAGAYLSNFLEAAREYTEEGFISVPVAVSSIEVEDVDLDGDMAVVLHCLVNGDQRVIEATGEVVDDEVNARRFEDSVVRGDDGWRIVQRAEVAEFLGQSECG